MRGAIALLVGAFAFVFITGTASADSESLITQPFTFTSDSTGLSVTCSIEAYVVVFGSNDDASRTAYTSIKASGDSPSCHGGTGLLAVSYRNSSGVSVRSGAGGDGSVYWTADDVGPGSKNVLVDFKYDFSDCASGCEFNTQAAPK